MKTLLRWAFCLLALLVVLVITAFLSLNPLARVFTERQLRKQTGMDVKIGRVNVGLFTSSHTIENLVIYNPPEFGGSSFIELPELHVDYDRTALRAGKLHCQLLRVNLSRINIIEDKNGRRNFEVLEKKAQSLTPQPSQPAAHPKTQNLTTIEFTGIDKLNLTLGKATYTRMNQPGNVEELNMNVDHQIFANVKTQQDLGSVLVVALLKSGANLMQSGRSQTWLQLLAPQTK